MKIVYEGYYGYKNAGDDSFVEVCAWGAKKYWSCENNFFVGKDLPQTLNNIKTENKIPYFKGLDRLKMFLAFNKANFIISAGGSTFSKIPSHSNKSLAKFYSDFSKTKLGAMGVSLGPFKNSKEENIVKDYLRSLSFLSLRDTVSYNYAKSIDNLPYVPIKAFDLAALLPLVYNYNEPKNNEFSEKKVLGISICNYESYSMGDINKEQKRNLFFEELIMLFSHKTNIIFKVFIINDHPTLGDRKISNELIRNIPSERVTIVNYKKNLKKTWLEISSCDCMISTRLHASIFACYAKIPFFLIEYHRKCADFLDDVGQTKKYRLYDADISPNEAFNIISRAIFENYIYPKNIKLTMDLAKKNFTETLFD